jgi:hypothetical protein
MEQTITGGTYTTNEFPSKEINDGFKKRVEKYLKLSHQTLAEMLAIRDEEDGMIKSEEDCPLQPNYPYTPSYPYHPYTPYDKWCPIGTGGKCTNPFGDCINCPYHGGVTYGTKYTTTCTANLNSDADSAGQKDNYPF